jgi:hypothetical protein
MASGTVYVMDEFDLSEIENALEKAKTIEDMKKVIKLLLEKLPVLYQG